MTSRSQHVEIIIIYDSLTVLCVDSPHKLTMEVVNHNTEFFHGDLLWYNTYFFDSVSLHFNGHVEDVDPYFGSVHINKD